MTNKEFNAKSAEILANKKEMLDNGISKLEANDYQDFNLGRLSARTWADYLSSNRPAEVVLH